MWPVTPYTLALRNHDSQAVWATVYVDGCKISKECVKPAETKEVQGIDNGASVKELLFSFPRLVSSEKDKLDSDRLSQVGCVSIV